MEFLRSFLWCHLAGNPVVASRNVGCFLSLRKHRSLAFEGKWQRLTLVKILCVCSLIQHKTWLISAREMIQFCKKKSISAEYILVSYEFCWRSFLEYIHNKFSIIDQKPINLNKFTNYLNNDLRHEYGNFRAELHTFLSQNVPRGGEPLGAVAFAS